MTIEIEIENISGIRQGRATLPAGVTAVKGSNWQGKTSLIDALQVGMGTKTALTEGAENGTVSLSVEGSEYEVRVERSQDGTVLTGGPYLSDEYDRIRARLFAFLDETNEIRTAVRDGENLEPLLTRPLDFEDIDERISKLQTEREQVERELERATDAAERLPHVVEDIAEFEAELDDLRERKADLQGSESSDSNANRDELSNARAERDRTESTIERLENALERLEEQLSEKREELDSLTVPDESNLESELAEERRVLSDLERDLELLRSVYEANERILEEDRLGLVASVEHSVLDDSISCWVCGEQTDREAFEAQLDAIRAQITEYERRASEHREHVEELESKREEITAKQRRERDLEREIADLERQRTDREESLETARADLEALQQRIDDLEATVAETDDELTDIESQRKYVERELTELRETRSTLESRADRRDTLESERADLTDEIEALRSRKASIKRELRETFDKAIDEVVARFETGFETARLTSTFDLVVARDGREASLDALSEGERELLGLVVALAGYLTFDVAEDVPLMLLDGLGGLADDNLQSLVAFLQEYPTYLVVTAYPEYGDYDGHELDPTEWTVVSRELADT